MRRTKVRFEGHPVVGGGSVDAGWSPGHGTARREGSMQVDEAGGARRGSGRVTETGVGCPTGTGAELAIASAGPTRAVGVVRVDGGLMRGGRLGRVDAMRARDSRVRRVDAVRTRGGGVGSVDDRPPRADLAGSAGVGVATGIGGSA